MASVLTRRQLANYEELGFLHSIPILSNLLPSRFGLLAFMVIVAAGT